MRSLRDGFTIDNPPIMVPWRLSQRKLVQLLKPHGLCEVARGYYTLKCTALSGLSLQLGFHFESGSPNAKFWLELFRERSTSLEESYQELQRHLEETFGPPTQTDAGEEGFPTHCWDIDNFLVGHMVNERFVLSEGCSIRPKQLRRSIVFPPLDLLSLLWLPVILVLCTILVAIVCGLRFLFR
jgi:hypothetical protein